MDVYATLQRDNYNCALCHSDTGNLNIHSLNFSNPGAKAIVTICDDCFEGEKSYRKKEERNLLEQLRKRRLGWRSIYQIANSFENMKESQTSDVLTSVIAWAMQKEDIMEQLHKLYCDEMYNNDLPF